MSLLLACTRSFCLVTASRAVFGVVHIVHICSRISFLQPHCHHTFNFECRKYKRFKSNDLICTKQECNNINTIGITLSCWLKWSKKLFVKHWMAEFACLLLHTKKRILNSNVILQTVFGQGSKLYLGEKCCRYMTFSFQTQHYRFKVCQNLVR